VSNTSKQRITSERTAHELGPDGVGCVFDACAFDPEACDGGCVAVPTQDRPAEAVYQDRASGPPRPVEAGASDTQAPVRLADTTAPRGGGLLVPPLPYSPRRPATEEPTA
jgi:hypothetical protein